MANDALDEAKCAQRSYAEYISSYKKKNQKVDKRVALMKEKLLPELKRFSKTIQGWDRGIFYNAYSPDQIIKMNEASSLEGEPLNPIQQAFEKDNDGYEMKM